MAGHALALVEELDCFGGNARHKLLAQQVVRHRVIVFVHLDVIIDTDAAFLPLGIGVW